MYCRAENQCHCCGIYHFQMPDLICETPARDPASLLSKRFPCSNREVRNVDSLTSGPHRNGHTPKRLTLQYVVLGPQHFQTDEIFAC